MFIDYLPLMLVNMASVLLVMAAFLVGEKSKCWAPAMGAAGLVAIVTGLAMVFTWPLPGSFNVAFGEMSVLLGAALLGASLAVAKGWSLTPIGVYILLPAAAAILVGVRIAVLDLTASPPMTAAGYILTGAGGLVAALSFFLGNHRRLARVAAALLLLAALLWALVGMMAYWAHLSLFAGYKPH